VFKIDELLKATKGKLIGGPRNYRITALSIDSRVIKKHEAFIAIRGNNFDGHDFIDEAIEKGASCIIKEIGSKECKSSSVPFIEVKNTVKALGDIARFQRQKFNIPVIAVTGSNGKTTVKEMIAWVLSKKFNVLKNEGTKNNQIGLPLTLLKLKSKHDAVVLEVGTNHFGEVQYLTEICLPNIGVITNIGPSHLEFLHNLKGVLNEKYKLIENLKSPYIAILNADDGLLRRKVVKRIRKPFTLGFGIKNKADFSATVDKIYGGGLEFLVNLQHKFILKTLGCHNIYNALVAVTLGRIFSMEYKEIALRLASFEFPAGRLKLIRLDKIKFIDDTYNSNPLSLKQALDVLGRFNTYGRKILVMGDMLELGSRKSAFHFQAGRQAAKICDALITVGKLSKLAADAARECGFDIRNIFTCESCRDAQDILFNKISPREDDIVLVKGSRAMKMEEIFKDR